MEKLVFHQISDSTYVGMITILDYEISLKKCLLDITIPPEINKDKRIIVDLVVKDVASHNYDICVLLLYKRENVPDG